MSIYGLIDIPFCLLGTTMARALMPFVSLSCLLSNVYIFTEENAEESKIDRTLQLTEQWKLDPSLMLMDENNVLSFCLLYRSVEQSRRLEWFTHVTLRKKIDIARQPLNPSFTRKPLVNDVALKSDIYPKFIGKVIITALLSVKKKKKCRESDNFTIYHTIYYGCRISQVEIRP